jgi:hypothetical protein
MAIMPHDNLSRTQVWCVRDQRNPVRIFAHAFLCVHVDNTRPQPWFGFHYKLLAPSVGPYHFTVVLPMDRFFGYLMMFFSCWGYIMSNGWLTEWWKREDMAGSCNDLFLGTFMNLWRERQMDDKCWCSRFPGWDSSPASPKFDAGVLITGPRRSVYYPIIGHNIENRPVGGAI